ncbi:MAG: cytidylyltransferase [Bacteroidia bacterium]
MIPWKINSDKFYRPLWWEYGDEWIKEAGYIEDNSPDFRAITTDLDCTPISFLLEKLKTAKNPAIILSTGAFCPIHDGHLEMIFKAKEAVENAGYDVIGGYIAPDNDEYVSRKANVLNIHERIAIINEQIKDIDWLAVDPWNGVFREYAENFTSLIIHLEKYIFKHLQINIPIFYVCGGDNAKFMMTFQNEGHCVVVDRPGSNISHLQLYFDSKRRLYIYNDNKNSSTEVRKTFVKNVNKRKKLLLRVDEYDEREEEVIAELSKHYDEIKISRIEKEKIVFEKITTPIISLDSILKSKYNLSISRRYDYYGIKSLGWTNRPGSDLIEKQLEKIPNEDFFLFDDDIHTGKTILKVKNLLKDKINVLGQISLTTSNETEEVLDCRDFYYNKGNCGLVILNSNEKDQRFPYVYPYVCPYNRASIMKPIEFSIAIWEINSKFFSKIGKEKLINHCEKMIKNLKFKI